MPEDTQSPKKRLEGRRPSKVPIETQLTAGFGLLLGFAIGIFVASYAIASKSIDTEMAVTQRHKVLLELSNAHHLMDKAESLTRAYLISPSNDYQRAFDDIAIEVPRHLQTAGANLPASEQVGQVTQLSGLTARLTNRLQGVMQTRQRGFEAGIKDMARYDASLERHLMNALFDRLESDQNAHLSQQLTQTNATFSSAALFFALLGLFVFAGFFLLVHRMYSGMIYQKRIEEDLAQRADELGELNEKLRASERIKSEFVATVSHELRTPLTLILSPLESLLAGESGPISAQQETHLKTMHNNTVRLLQLITGLLDFSRAEAGRLEVKREPTDVSTLTRSVLSDFEPAITQKRLSLVADLPDIQQVVEIDRYLYERILFNLMSNAVKFTPDGGEIKVSLNSDQDKIILSVADTGIGIPESDLNLIFQKFRQAEAPSTRRFEGTGLGLALVMEFTNLLGGTVSAKSTPGSGSTFTVEIFAPLSSSAPVAPIGERGVTVPQHAVPLPASNENSGAIEPGLPKVLVAEDNAELATYVASVLQDFCQVKLARDGAEALECVRHWKPDLVLMDVMMPNIDGLTVCRKVKSDPALSNTPVVLLTALTNRDALLRGWESGADEYLFKPFHPKELSSRIKSILHGVAERKRAEELAFKQQKAEQIKDFMSTLAHDLQVPLLGASRVFEMVMSGQLGEVPEEIATLIQQIHAKNQFLLRLTNNLLEIYRYESGTKELTFSDLSIEGLVTQAVGEARSRQDAAGITIKAEVEKDLPPIHADAKALTSLLHQLIDNAIKFTPHGGEVTLHASNGQDKVAVRVWNSGSYVSPQEISQLFDKFWRGQPGKKYVANTGLGLYLCKRIVEAHNGEISCTSEPDSGTTISVTLPAAKVADTAFARQ
ncbi:MAG TPA: ATP-binding protein [Candidatus Obscuribacterales bacterium]